MPNTVLYCTSTDLIRRRAFLRTREGVKHHTTAVVRAIMNSSTSALLLLLLPLLPLASSATTLSFYGEAS